MNAELNASDVWRAQTERQRDTTAERETAANNCTAFERVAGATTRTLATTSAPRRPRACARARVHGGRSSPLAN
jgi:hypothetical protein